MGKITEITKQKNKSRLNVFIDGDFACGLNELTVLKYSLKVGDEIEQNELEEIQMKSEEQSAMDNAMKYATTYVKSEAQMRAYLFQKGYMSSLVDKILTKLKYYGYINDEKLAYSYVSFNKEKKGVNKIKLDLLKMEIDREIIDNALEEIDDIDQQTACEKYAQKYMKTHKNAQKQKLMAHLYSKGFSMSDIYKTVDNFEFEGGEI